ncbi:4a-hydroxytetrahydrobiopterin dehydratase [Crossiella equi]|uniref:Putative pterin-4-alpha-carbinolamine dehydratase n=1 Tax=Crossiella equi TaxID=130796 RepID=A0ABS5AIL6_9PSEU|nr:4a-hydroxytetrahydrobiopterin dehydratase [Crossiella equi]MBP2476423.1 4a-hydroxytetrahydrobiopterin dehydratase [Crossiella equi]
MADLLTEDQIKDHLLRLPQWRHEGRELVRTVELDSFPQAIQVVNRVAEIAENDNHHPDVDIRWRTLTFRCSTHYKGGITDLDISLVQEIDQVIDLLTA